MDSLPKEFSGFEASYLDLRVWRAGWPNVSITPYSARVGQRSLTLRSGVSYEVEGAMAEVPGRARALAVVQDLAKASDQLKEPADPRTLYERKRPPIWCLVPKRVPVLLAVGEEAEERFALNRSGPYDHLIGQTGAWRRAIGELRAEGWTGAIAFDGLGSGARMVTIPLHYLRRGQVAVERPAKLVEPVPRPLVDFTLGRVDEFPPAAEIGGMQVARRRRVVTRSWRPALRVV